MELKLNNLNIPKERVYFSFLALLSAIIWILILITVVGPIVGLFIAFFSWLGNGLLVAHLRSNSLRVDEEQMPTLFKTFKNVCERLNISLPELYILQSGGALNAFAMRHSGRDFVVLYSNLIEDFDLEGDEIRFYLGHEIGHIKSKHIFKQIFLMPALWVPLLGPAYHRACETSCDRFGAYVVTSMDGAIKALMVLAGGKKLSMNCDVEIFSKQFSGQRGFFISWYELISGYPTLSHRVANLLALKNNQNEPRYSRNPLAYFFALFSFGVTPNVGSYFVIIAIVALLAAIAIPNLLRAKISANDALAKGTLRTISTAAETYATVNGGQYPDSIEDLTNSSPPYLNSNYCSQIIAGFSYACNFGESGYEIKADPVTVGTSGTESFAISTGGILEP